MHSYIYMCVCVYIYIYIYMVMCVCVCVDRCYILSCGREMRMVAKQRTYRYNNTVMML